MRIKYVIRRSACCDGWRNGWWIYQLVRSKDLPFISTECPRRKDLGELSKCTRENLTAL